MHRNGRAMNYKLNWWRKICALVFFNEFVRWMHEHVALSRFNDIFVPITKCIGPYWFSHCPSCHAFGCNSSRGKRGYGVTKQMTSSPIHQFPLTRYFFLPIIQFSVILMNVSDLRQIQFDLNAKVCATNLIITTQSLLLTVYR